MSPGQRYLHDIKRLAEKLTREFGTLPYEQFAANARKVESAVMGLVIMKEGWTWLPTNAQRQLASIDWDALIGKWDRRGGRHVGVDVRKLWETIVHRLPAVSKQIEGLLKNAP